MDFNMDKSLGFLLTRAGMAMKVEFHRQLKPYDITIEQWGVLNRLGEQDGVTQKNVAERTTKDQPNTARILDKLEKKGLSRRANDPKDRRAFLIFLTDKGRVLREKIIPISNQLNKDASMGMSKKELSDLLGLLDKVHKNFAE